MKPTPNLHADLAPLMAFGAHPDDIEFGCGGVIASEVRLGRKVHLIVCSRGESGTNGSPQQRTREAEESARILGASLTFVELDGDAHLELKVAHTLKLAAEIRRYRPGVILAPTPNANQHPDHARLSRIVRDAARLARYGGVGELKDAPPHPINQLLFYALSTEAEPKDATPILYDVSSAEVLAQWTAAMEAHATQSKTRNYVELQLTRARLNGLRAGIGHAIALFSEDPLVVGSLATIGQSARRF